MRNSDSRQTNTALTDLKRDAQLKSAALSWLQDIESEIPTGRSASASRFARLIGPLLLVLAGTAIGLLKWHPSAVDLSLEATHDSIRIISHGGEIRGQRHNPPSIVRIQGIRRNSEQRPFTAEFKNVALGKISEIEWIEVFSTSKNEAQIAVGGASVRLVATAINQDASFIFKGKDTSEIPIERYRLVEPIPDKPLIIFISTGAVEGKLSRFLAEFVRKTSFDGRPSELPAVSEAKLRFPGFESNTSADLVGPHSLVANFDEGFITLELEENSMITRITGPAADVFTGEERQRTSLMPNGLDTLLSKEWLVQGVSIVSFLWGLIWGLRKLIIRA